MTLQPFPPSLLFGVGNSDSQCEAYEAPFADIRDLWYDRRRLTARGKATDFWNRFQEDVRLAASLGCRLFRFSISWARIEPTFGQFSEDALTHYSDLVDAIHAAGMEPMVTLLHFTWPVHIEARGGLLADDFPSTFATYVEKVVARIGPRVKYWITLNEPNILSFGYSKPWWERNYFFPPGLPPEATSADQMAASIKLMPNLFKAHTAARNAIKLVRPDAMVGANAANLGLPVWAQRFLDRNVINLRNEADAEKSGRGFAERQVLEQGKIDVIIATFTKDDERASQVEFAEVYFMAASRIMVPAASTAAVITDLARQKVAAVRTSTGENAVRTLMPGSELVSVKQHVDGVAMLEAGQVAAMVADDVRLRAIMQQQPGRFRLLAPTLTKEPYAPAITKGNPLLLDEVDQAVRDFIESGAWAESYRRHIGEPVPEPPQQPRLANLSDVTGAAGTVRASATPAPAAGHREEMLDQIRRRGRLIVGAKDDVPGLAFRDERTGTWEGLEIDIARAVARRIFGNQNALELVPVATRERMPFVRSLFRFLDPLLKAWGLITTSATTNWWHLGMAGKLKPFLCPTACVGQLDFVGFDYYWGVNSLGILRLLKLIDALVAGRMENAPVYPDGLYNWLQLLGGMFPQLPIFIVENGCVEVAEGVDRRSYLTKHLQQVQRATTDGINVGGYLCWSITTNRELGHRYAPNTDFGLYHIDLDGDAALVRQITPSADTYRAIIQARTVPDA